MKLITFVIRLVCSPKQDGFESIGITVFSKAFTLKLDFPPPPMVADVCIVYSLILNIDFQL